MLSAESSGTRFSNVTPVVDGARRSKSAGGSAERRHPGSASASTNRQTSSASEEAFMSGTSARITVPARRRVGEGLLLGALLAGCAQGGQRTTDTPAPARQEGSVQGAT